MKTKTKKSSSKSRGKPRNSRRQPQWGAVPQQSSAGKILLTTLAIGAAGVAGYFGWQYYKKKRNAKKSDPEDDFKLVLPDNNPVHTETPKTKPKDVPYVPPVFNPVIPPIVPKPKPKPQPKEEPAYKAGDTFPLKKGSKGETVRQLQQALIDKYGKGVLPKYGADGDFGSETQNALKKQGLPTVVSETTFNVIIQGSSAKTDHEATAKKLYDAATGKNLNSVLSLLKNIKNTEDYQKVSNSFMKNRLHGVRQTLVNGLLGSFAATSQKEKIRMEFIRIGLQYDGNKWSLSGFDGKPIVTTEAATVWITATQSVQVPALMVLGNEVTQRLDYTLFENNNKYFLIKTQSVKYL